MKQNSIKYTRKNKLGPYHETVDSNLDHPFKNGVGFQFTWTQSKSELLPSLVT